MMGMVSNERSKMGPAIRAAFSNQWLNPESAGLSSIFCSNLNFNFLYSVSELI